MSTAAHTLNESRAGSEPAGATAAIASFVARPDFSTLDAQAMDKAAQVITDSLACMLAGSASELSAPLLAYANLPEIAAGPGRIVGRRQNTTPAVAALLNGSFAAALDYDDLMTPMHPSAVVVAALVAGIGPLPVSGMALIQAYAAGIEVGAKISRALGAGHSRRGFHATSTLSGFSAFCALAQLKSGQGQEPLSEEQIAIGLSLMASQSGGLLCQLGTMAKPLHSGLAARNAHETLRMCRHGLTASATALEARRGYFEAYGDEMSDPGAIAASLGKPWAISSPGSTLKRFPSSIAGHRGIMAVLDLKARGLNAANLAHLDCAVAPGALRPMMYPQPANGLQSKFSMPYALAAALLEDRIGIASFETAAVHRPEIHALLARIHAWEDPRQALEDPVSANLSWGYRGYVRLTATLTDGSVLTARVDTPPGTPRQPLGWQDLRQKLADCAAQAGLDAATSDSLFTSLHGLPHCADVRPLLAQL